MTQESIMSAVVTITRKSGEVETFEIRGEQPEETTNDDEVDDNGDHS